MPDDFLIDGLILEKLFIPGPPDELKSSRHAILLFRLVSEMEEYSEEIWGLFNF